MKAITKTLVILLSLTFIYTFQAYSQEEDAMNKKEKMMAERYVKMQQLKVAFITEHLELTVEEAEKFWPVYRKYEAQRNEITSDLFKSFEGPGKKEVEMTEAEAKELIVQRLKEERALVELKFQSLGEYLEVIPATKVYKLYQTENNFRRHLMDRLGQRGRDMDRVEPGAKGKPGPERQGRR